MAKAVGLFSGGLDSAIATRLMADQGIRVIALNFSAPFNEFGSRPRVLAERLGASFREIRLADDYISVLRNPRYGFGKALNPCVDCRIHILRKARAIAEQEGADFVFTGEVLGQRPKSQQRKEMGIVEKESGLDGRLLRPLSARLLDETVPEKDGIVDREKLLDISGRSRKRQLELAKGYGIEGFSTPAGGCRLTNKEYAAKVKDLLTHNRELGMEDLGMLNHGRHFRLGSSKIIVGKDQADNEEIRQGRGMIIEAQGCGSPVTMLQGAETKKAVEAAARLTALYSDSDGETKVRCGSYIMVVRPMSRDRARRLMVTA